MKVSPATAKRVLGMLAMHDDNAGAAAHDVAISIQATRPYSDSGSERVREVLAALARIDRDDPERGARWRVGLAPIAAKHGAETAGVQS